MSNTSLSVNQTQGISHSNHDECLRPEHGDFVPWDNPDNIITERGEFWITMVMSVGAIPLLWVVGSVGNVLSGLVFYRQGLSQRINMCLFCLALADLASITVLFLLSSEGAYRELVGPSHFFIRYFVGLTGFSFVSQMLSTVIACERCFCVVSPLKAQRLLSTRKLAVFIALATFVLLGGILAIVGPKHTVACVYDPATNLTTNIVYFTSYYLKNKEIIDIFDVFVYSTAFPAIVLTIIVVTTAITATRLRSVVQWRHQSVFTVTSSSSAGTTAAAAGDGACGDKKNGKTDSRTMKEVALTRMLMATSVLFVLCLTPNLFVQIAIFVVPELHYNGRYHNLVTVLWGLVSFTRVLNSSLNFFVYYFMGSKFRETLRQILPCMKRQLKEILPRKSR